MSGHVVPQARHGPQQGARYLGIFGQDPTRSRAPLGLLPGPQNCLGATVQGRNHPGPQGESEAQ